ncbi:hypothetical protein QYF36_007520 [Acer negundo]|nr:hypothetical protein QYF36_007520 [Acer negundo]
MTETLSPRQRAGAMSNRLRSPTMPFYLDSNNDELERAQARAARAAVIRRKVAAIPETPSPDDPCLSDEQIVELFQNCIKLASENKINQKNTWELKLIDHLSELIKVETVGDSETNFQKASCTLEAGVKIYSVRVDSVHAEAYKVLCGINRVGQEHEQETTTVCNNVGNEQDEGCSKKESEKKISPLLTLESSFEALNVKKFDVAFAVDPLYHQTSAQFDEGGAKGLLLNNLGVYGGCLVLFDSFEVPGKCNSYPLGNNTSDMIDISFITEFTEQMVANMRTMSEISPTLKEIICHFDEDNQRLQNVNLGQKFDSREDSLNASPEAFDDAADAFDANAVGLDDNSFGNCEAWRNNHDREAGFVNENFGSDSTFNDHYEENDPYTAYEADVEDRFEGVTTFLFQGIGFTSKQNAWAGPDHWKFRKFKGSDNVCTGESGSAVSPKKQKKRTNAEVDIDFMKSLDREVLDIFAPPRSLKSLLLPANRALCSNTLPEDCHYEPENLVKLFLLPNVLCTGKRRRKFSDNSSGQQNDGYTGAVPSWDNDSVLSGQYDDECSPNDVEVSDELISQPRQVDKIQVHYDKTSKQVDVHVLKETLWNRLKEFIEVSGTVSTILFLLVSDDTISFKRVLVTFPVDCQAAAPKDISSHLCFICLLHLANEHGLSIHDSPSLDDLSIHLPSAHQNTEGVVHDSL